MLEEALSPERTNFRFAIRRNDTGTLVYSNLEGAASLDESVHAVEQEELSLTQNGAAREQDYVVWNGKEQYYLLYIALPDAAGTKQLVPPEDAGLAAQYGYTFDGYTWNYDEQMDSRVTTSVLALEYGATDPLTVQDEFWDSYQDYQQYASYLPALAVLALVLDIAGILLLVFLLRAAGWRKEESRPRCNWFDRIPLDLLAFGAFWAIALLLNAGDAIAFGLNVSQLATDLLVGMCVITVAILGCVLAFCLTVATRIKTRTLWSNTLIYMLCKLIARGCRAAARSWPMTGRVVVLFLLYLAGTLFTTLTIFLIPVFQGFVLYCLCRWTIQWKRVREGTGRIVGGDPDFKIDTHKMYSDLARHAGQLNDLGAAIGNAVDERIQSERFKAELITNVSHDLKTPLTSIINYVDLLKKQDIDNPKAQEYIEVLDRKSQRLKKLTEDLVEASKASTGSLSVHLDRLGMVQLVQQALGEFEEKFRPEPPHRGARLPGGGVLHPGRRPPPVAGHRQPALQLQQVRPGGHPHLCGGVPLGGQGGPVHQEHLPPAPQHPRRAAHGAVRPGGGVPHHRGLRPGPVHCPQPHRAPGRHLPPGHRRRSLQGRGLLPGGRRTGAAREHIGGGRG